MRTYVTEYRVTYKGGHCIVARDRQDAEDYIDAGIRAGCDPDEYAVEHRTVTYGDWALTTPPRFLLATTSPEGA